MSNYWLCKKNVATCETLTIKSMICLDANFVHEKHVLGSVYNSINAYLTRLKKGQEYAFIRIFWSYSTIFSMTRTLAIDAKRIRKEIECNAGDWDNKEINYAHNIVYDEMHFVMDFYELVKSFNRNWIFFPVLFNLRMMLKESSKSISYLESLIEERPVEA